MVATLHQEPAATSALLAEFDRHVATLAAKGYAERAGLGQEELRAALELLRGRAAAARPSDTPGRIPFVLVPDPALVPPAEAIALAELRGKPGFTTVEAADLLRFAPNDGLEVPGGLAYLLFDVDTGRETLNVTPDDAAMAIAAEGRSPLTLAEGLAVVMHLPGILKAANSFSMLGSRCGDRRVTAFWMSGGRPRLGWCWAGNPHTWLGSASCAGRAAL